MSSETGPSSQIRTSLFVRNSQTPSLAMMITISSGDIGCARISGSATTPRASATESPIERVKAVPDAGDHVEQEEREEEQKQRNDVRRGEDEVTGRCDREQREGEGKKGRNAVMRSHVGTCRRDTKRLALPLRHSARRRTWIGPVG